MFISPDFLLTTETAKHLYHDHAEKMPIIDYHCHLNPKEVAENHRFSSITELWLGGDHYKWRQMRANGVDERYITGDATDWEKFQKWAETIQYALRNPLYHWTHLELRTAFGINKILNPQTAREIFDECNEKLKLDEYSAQGLMRRYNVESVCTTDDPVDSLEWHEKYARENTDGPLMLPAWRPDKAMAIEKDGWREYIATLARVSGVEISSYATLIEALQVRHEFFAAHGCRLSDHGIDRFFADEYTPEEIEAIFSKAIGGVGLTEDEINKFRSAMLYDFAVMDNEAGWVQQFHYGPLRNNNTRMFRALGPDAGFDSMGEWPTAVPMSRFFDRLATEGKLTKTIVYNHNPKDNDMVATMIGNFQDGTVPGKMQWGSGWWFLDQKRGIENQLDTLSLHGLLSRFVGMLTDSRSFLSYPRHEYFRRILCNILGNDIENGEIPLEEMPRVEQMVEDICYYNAKRYFGPFPPSSGFL